MERSVVEREEKTRSIVAWNMIKQLSLYTLWNLLISLLNFILFLKFHQQSEPSRAGISRLAHKCRGGLLARMLGSLGSAHSARLILLGSFARLVTNPALPIRPTFIPHSFTTMPAVLNLIEVICSTLNTLEPYKDVILEYRATEGSSQQDMCR